MRIQYYDILRAVSIIFVVGIHVIKVPNELISAGNYEFVIFRQLINLAVPLFLGISGYFLADKNVSVRKDYLLFIIPQIKRVLVPYIVWGIIYSTFYLLLKESLADVVYRFVTFQIAVPFYFIALIIQYYILLPWMQKLGNSSRGVYFSILITLISAFLIFHIRYYTNFNLPTILYAGFFPTWMGFFVIGVYAKKRRIKFTDKLLLPLAAFFLALSIAETLWEANSYHKIADAFSAVKVSSFLYSFTMLALLLKQKRKIYSQFLAYIGQVSFGIFFVHMIVYLVINAIIPKHLLNSYISQLALVLFVIITCTSIGFICRKINKVAAQKYLGF